MSAVSWRLIENKDETWEAIILQDGAEVDRETLDDSKAANKWVSSRLREMGVL